MLPQPGEKIEVFSRMPPGYDNGYEAQRLEVPGERWILAPTPRQGTLRPRIGWTERWLPATAVENGKGVDGRSQVRFRWDVHLWFDWASGERLDTSNPQMLLDVADPRYVRLRTPNWNLGLPSQMPSGDSEVAIGGVPVKVSFVVFRWGAARVPIQYDQHSWGAPEGSTVSARFLALFFNQGVLPRLGLDYEVITVFIQHSDEFKGISESFIASLCRGKHICALYFLWPTQRQQTYGDTYVSTAAYVDEKPFFEMVSRFEATGIPTRWPHHSQLWRCLSNKDWVNALSAAPMYHVPLTTRVPKSLILADSQRAARQALDALWLLQEDRRADPMYQGPRQSDWIVGQQEQCVAKLGFSYEGTDVKMCIGSGDLAQALYTLAMQPGYMNDCVHVQQRVHRVDLEARCFVIQGEIVDILWTRFARIDNRGYVRDYEKAHSGEEAMRKWFQGDADAWRMAEQQIRELTRRWWTWLLSQSAEPIVSVRIDYMLERTCPGRGEVWTGEIGEQGYSMGGIDPLVVFNIVIDTIGADVCRDHTKLLGGSASQIAKTGQSNAGCPTAWWNSHANAY